MNEWPLMSASRNSIWRDCAATKASRGVASTMFSSKVNRFRLFVVCFNCYWTTNSVDAFDVGVVKWARGLPVLSFVNRCDSETRKYVFGLSACLEYFLAFR